MTLNIMTILAITVVALIWTLISYCTYVHVADQPLARRNWVDKTLPRRIILVLIAPVFWCGVFILLAFIEPMWDRLKPVIKRWRETKHERHERSIMRRRNFVFDPPS